MGLLLDLMIGYETNIVSKLPNLLYSVRWSFCFLPQENNSYFVYRRQCFGVSWHQRTVPVSGPCTPTLRRGQAARAQGWPCCGRAATLDQIAVKTAMWGLWYRTMRSLIPHVPPSCSGTAFKLSLRILSFELCCSSACALPCPSLSLTCWLACLAKP